MDHLTLAGPSAGLLLDTLPLGVLVLGADGTVQALNQQAAAWWGRPPADVQGQPLATLAPAPLPAGLYQALQALAAGVELPPAEFFLPHAQQWITQTSARQMGQLVVYWQPITAQQQAAAALLASEEKYRTLFDTVEDGFAVLELLLDESGQPVDFVYQETNPAFVRHVGRELRGQRRSDLFAEKKDFLLERYAVVAATGAPLHLDHEVSSLGDQWFQVAVSRIGGPGSRHLGVVFRNITVRKRQEANLALLAELSAAFAPLLSAEQIMTHVSKHLADYLHLSRCHLAVADPAADRLDIIFDWRRDVEHLPAMLGEHRISDNLTEAGRQHFGAGRPLVMNGREPSPLVRTPLGVIAGLGFGSFVDIPYLLDGRWRFLLTVARAEPGEWRPDEVALLQELATRIYLRLERAQAETTLQEAHSQLVGALESTSDAFYDLDAELRFTYVNGRAAQFWGREPGTLLGRHFWTEFPQVVGSEPYRQHYQVLQTGQPVHFEAVSPVANRWIEASLYPNRQGGLSSFFRDITARKQAEQAQQASEEQQAFLLQLSDALRQLLDPADMQATAARVLGQHLDADRAYYVDLDEAAQEYVVARDWHRPGAPSYACRYPLGDWPMPWLLNGQAWVCHDLDTDPTLSAEQRADYRGDDIRAAVVVPLLKQERLVAALVINQNRPRAWAPPEVALVEEVAERTWAAVERVKAEAALGATEMRYRTDLEDQVQAQTAELQQSRDLLQATLDSSLDMIQVFSAIRDETGHIVDFCWLLNNNTSENLYGEVRGQRLLERNPGVMAEGIFADFQRVVETGEPQQVERQYAHEQFNGWFLQSVVKLGDGVATSTKDITAWKDAQAEILHLRLSQQQALFEAVQAAEEAERRRMSESLHNGIGQILYATKLRLDQLTAAPQLAAVPALNTARHEANQLLGNAIRQTRTLSHELVPLVLEEFGLAAALRDISSKMSSPQLRLHCQVLLDDDAAPLAPALQLALYRMAQELAQNIVKHASGATEASLELETTPGWVLLRVEDNGPSFAASPAPAAGLGLRSIRDRVALLGGSMQTGTLPYAGAYVRIRLPLRAT